LFSTVSIALIFKEALSNPSLSKKIEMLKKFREIEDNQNVLNWVDEFVRGLEQFVESEKMDEDLRGF